MSNLFKRFERLLPRHPLRVGTVLSVDGTTALVQEPGGGVVRVRGDATTGAKDYFRDSTIEGPAPNLPLEVIEE